MKKAFIIVATLIIAGVVTACSKKGSDRSNGENCYGADCSGIGYGSASGGYGYVGGGNWKGKVVVTNAKNFQAFMRVLQPMQCFAANCVISAQYADLQLKLQNEDLPQEVRWAMRTHSSGMTNGTMILDGTAYSSSNGSGFGILKEVYSNGINPMAYPYGYGQNLNNAAAKVHKIEVLAKFADESRRYLRVAIRFNGSIIAQGTLRGRSSYDDGQDYYRNGKISATDQQYREQNRRRNGFRDEEVNVDEF